MFLLDHSPRRPGQLPVSTLIRVGLYLLVLLFTLGLFLTLRGSSGSMSGTLGRYLGGLKGIGRGLPLQVSALKVVRGEQFGYSTAPTGMKFIKITIKIVSTSDEPYFLIPDMFKLMDTDGNSYVCLQASPLFADRIQGDGEGFYMGPGEDLESELVFQIPLRARERNLRVEPPKARK